MQYLILSLMPQVPRVILANTVINTPACVFLQGIMRDYVTVCVSCGISVCMMRFFSYHNNLRV